MVWGDTIPQRRLELAISQGEFKVFYQAKVNTKKEILGYEALCRWGAYKPSEFFTSALVYKMFLPLSLSIAKNVARDLTLYPMPYVSINLSPIELLDLSHLLKLMEILEPHASRVKFEITEDAILDDKALGSLRFLHRQGFLLGLDDFGVGYPRMAALPKLPINYIKFDRSLCVQCFDPDYYQFLSHWCEYFRSKFKHSITNETGIPVTAEGVETEEQYEILKKIGFNCFQGFLFGKPSPPYLLFDIE